MSSEQAGNEIWHLPKLIDIQPQAIVSRTLVKREQGNVTLFAFDAGEYLSEHTSPHDALLIVLDGECQVTIGENPSVLTKDDAILMPANVPHAVHAKSPMHILLVMIHE